MYPELPQPADSAPARAGVAERLSQLVAVPTVSAERDQLGPEPFEDFVALVARLYPVTHERLEFERIGDLGLVYRWAPATETLAAPVVLMAHWDVVPVTGQEDRWTHPPFGGVIADGLVHGRGTLDDKGALCTLLEAVENLVAEGFAPAREVWLCLGGDEETYGEAARRIAETLHGRGVLPWLVLDEGGAISDLPLPGLSGWFAMIGLAEKGVLAVELSATADAGHASAPTGLTAVGRISRAVSRLNRNPFRPNLPRTVSAMMLRLAEHAGPGYAQAYRAAAAAPWLTARLLQFAGHEAAAMARTTVAPTMVAGGSAANVLPSQASATLNVRVNIGETTAGVTARIRRVIADPAVGVRAVEASEPSAESSPDTAQFALLARALRAGYPGVPAIPYLVTGATDARHWHRLGSNVYRFAPLQLDAAQRASIHGVDERVTIEALIRGERCYRALLQGLSTGGEHD
ncbi:MAG TPA: M20/M25/M40 family metallo-hydrolase [Friedmanniella sp.]